MRLDTPTLRRLVRVLRRRLVRRGAPRPDVEGAERLDWRFLRYIATYNRQQRPRLLRELARHPTSTCCAAAPTCERSCSAEDRPRVKLKLGLGALGRAPIELTL
jgi:hypothetical protein